MPIITISTDDVKETVEPAQVTSSKDAPTPSTDEDTNQSASALQETDETAKDSETLETDEAEEGESEEDNEEEKPKKKSGFQKRIDKLSKAKAAAEQEREYWRQEALKNSPQQTEKESVETRITNDGEPNADDFDDHIDYVKAVARYEYNQAKLKDETDRKQNELKSKHENKLNEHSKRVMAFAETVDDFEDVVEDIGQDYLFSPALSELILESDIGPQVLYSLGKDMKELERINSLSPLAAAREFGKLEARLSKTSEETPKEKQTKPTTKAPAPLKTVGTKSSGMKKSLEDMTQKEYERERERQIASRYS
jgi:hypothetical protein